MPSPAVEDYLKHILLLTEQAGADRVSTGDLARALTVTPGTATLMSKQLATQAWVDYQPRRGVALTADGRREALQILRRHRIVELFLVEVLGLDWADIHAEAEALEHTVSARVIHAMDRVLGHPEFDPHGDPIPNADGALPRRTLPSLRECPRHAPQRIARVLDQDPAFLQFVTAHGLEPGRQVTVTAREPVAAATTVERDNGKALTVGDAAAEKILVEPVA